MSWLDQIFQSQARGYEPAEQPTAPTRLPTAEAFFPASPERKRAAADAFGRGDIAGGVGQALGAMGEAIGRGAAIPVRAVGDVGGRFIQGLTGSSGQTAAPSAAAARPATSSPAMSPSWTSGVAPENLPRFTLGGAASAPEQPPKPQYELAPGPYNTWYPPAPDLRTVKVIRGSAVQDYQVPADPEVRGEFQGPFQWKDTMERLMPDGTKMLYARDPNEMGKYQRIVTPAEQAAARAAAAEEENKRSQAFQRRGQGVEALRTPVSERALERGLEFTEQLYQAEMAAAKTPAQRQAAQRKRWENLQVIFAPTAQQQGAIAEQIRRIQQRPVD